MNNELAKASKHLDDLRAELDAARQEHADVVRQLKSAEVPAGADLRKLAGQLAGRDGELTFVVAALERQVQAADERVQHLQHAERVAQRDKLQREIDGIAAQCWPHIDKLATLLQQIADLVNQSAGLLGIHQRAAAPFDGGLLQAARNEQARRERAARRK